MCTKDLSQQYLKIKIIAIYQIEVVRNVFKIATNVPWLCEVWGLVYPKV